MYFWPMHLLSSYSLWWIFPIFLVSGLISYLFYQKEAWLSTKSKQLRIILFSLRTLSLALIACLLLGLLFEQTQFDTEKPIVLTLIDRSSSMNNYKESPLIAKRIAAYQTKLQEKLAGRFELQTWDFGKNLQPPKQGFTDRQTNMELPFEQAANQFINRNLGAVVLISDGNYNVGGHPMYSAENLPLTAVYSLAVGDTALKKDLIVANTAYNDLVFLNNNFTIEIDLEAQRLGSKTIRTDLYEDGKKIASQSSELPSQRSSQLTLQFELKAKKPGIHEYKIVVQKIAGEFTYQNNTRTVYIEVIDSRSKILLYSHAPHPDIAALQQALAGNENYEVLVKYSNDLRSIPVHTLDLVIWHDPGKGFSSEFLESLQTKKIPIWTILGTQTDQQIASKLQLGLQLDLRQQLEEIQASPNPGFALYQPDQEWLSLAPNLPPLTKRFGEARASAGTQVLLTQRVGNLQKNTPLMTFNERNQQRHACLLGEGLWRWRMVSFLKKQDHRAFDAFVGEICAYLLVKKEGSGLRVQAPKKLTSSDNCILNASFYNEAMQAITSPKISWELDFEHKKLRKGNFSTKGEFYQQQLGKLKAGRYYWKASTTHNQKKYVKTGAFIVEDIDLEQLESAARHSTLLQLADQTDAKVFALQDYNRLIDRLEKNDDLVALRTESHQFDPLLDFLLLLLLLSALLVAEWFLRRYNGSY
ncbi:MAG: hypothetical protein EB003_08055 [Flavobacteriia bacterium]|nr:hypothetical protein [Flavobacteriia bacterium]